MHDASIFLRYYLVAAMLVLAALAVFCLARAVIGPRFTDRLVALNSICTFSVLIIGISHQHIEQSNHQRHRHDGKQRTQNIQCT